MPILLLLRGVCGSGKSTVALRVSEHFDNSCVMELDDVKLRKYGTTEKCVPNVDFEEFGRDVATALKSRKFVVAVEAFVDKFHIDLFLKGLKMDIPSEEISVVWLECSADIAVQRKKEVLLENVVRDQHRRIPNRVKYDDELCIDTTGKTIEQVALKIVEHIRSS